MGTIVEKYDSPPNGLKGGVFTSEPKGKESTKGELDVLSPFLGGSCVIPEVRGHIVRDFILHVPTKNLISRTFIVPRLHLGEVSDIKIFSSCLTEVSSCLAKKTSLSPGIDVKIATVIRGFE